MTTTTQVDLRCGLCGCVSAFTIVSSTNRMGASDLDLRPPSMERETLALQVQECPHCGYCAPSLDEPATTAIGDLLASAGMQALAADAGLPPLTRRFVRLQRIQVANARPDLAGWSALKAAWTCDDARFAEPARDFRRAAAALWQEAEVLGLSWCHDPWLARVARADVLRRGGDFTAAAALATVSLAALRAQPQPDGVVHGALLLQQDHAERRDDSALDFSRADQRDPDRDARIQAAARQRADKQAEERRAQSPAATLAALAATPIADDAEQALKQWKQLPWQPRIGKFLTAHRDAGAWPPGMTLAAIGLVLHRRLGSSASLDPAVVEAWQERCLAHGALLDHLSRCLQPTTAQEWHYLPAEGVSCGHPPTYRVSCDDGLSETATLTNWGALKTGEIVLVFDGVTLCCRPEQTPPDHQLGVTFQDVRFAAFVTPSGQPADWPDRLRSRTMGATPVQPAGFVLRSNDAVQALLSEGQVRVLRGSEMVSGQFGWASLALRTEAGGMVVQAGRMGFVTRDGTRWDEARIMRSARHDWLAYQDLYWRRRSGPDPLPTDSRCETLGPPSWPARAGG